MSGIYNIENTLSRIDQAKHAGENLAIFLGRSNGQSLPEQQGWQWFSLDMYTDIKADFSRHLEADFNDAAFMDRIARTFHRVIVDHSTIKFVHEPWPTLHNLLVLHPESEVIVEGDAASSSISMGADVVYKPERFTMSLPIGPRLRFYDQEDENFDQWRSQVGETIYETRYAEYKKSREGTLPEGWTEEQKESAYIQDFKREILKEENIEPDPIPSYVDYLPGLYATIQAYASENFFHEVTLHQNEVYPYRSETLETNFFIARNPIVKN